MITYFFLHKSLWSDKRNKKTSQWLMLLELGGGSSTQNRRYKAAGNRVTAKLNVLRKP